MRGMQWSPGHFFNIALFLRTQENLGFGLHLFHSPMIIDDYKAHRIDLVSRTRTHFHMVRFLGLTSSHAASDTGEIRNYCGF